MQTCHGHRQENENVWLQILANFQVNISCLGLGALLQVIIKTLSNTNKKSLKLKFIETKSFIFCHCWSMQGESCDKLLTFGKTSPHLHIHGPKIFNYQNMSKHLPSWAINDNFCLLRLRQWNIDGQGSPNRNVTNVAKLDDLNRGVINNC